MVFNPSQNTDGFKICKIKFWPGFCVLKANLPGCFSRFAQKMSQIWPFLSNLSASPRKLLLESHIFVCGASPKMVQQPPPPSWHHHQQQPQTTHQQQSHHQYDCNSSCQLWSTKPNHRIMGQEEWDQCIIITIVKFHILRRVLCIQQASGTYGGIETVP